MSKNLSEIPFTELTEKIANITRSPDNAKHKIRGAINDIYCREIPFKWDWNFLLASSSIVVNEEYKTGTISINTGSNSVVFSSDASVDASSTGKQLKISGNDAVYDFTYSNTTGGTINPIFYGSSNASGNSYSLYQSKYSLAEDFERFPKNGGVYKWTGGRKEILPEESYQEDASEFIGSPSTPEKIRLVETDTLGRQMIRFRPGPNKQKIYGYDYIREISPMKENTSGTVSISASSTTVTGSLDCRFTESNTGDYIRINAFGTADDSTWYRISSIAHDSSLTIQPVFSTSGVVATNFVISSVPKMPTKLHPSILWGAVRQITVDQNDENSVYYISKYQESIADAKKLYVSRVYSQEVTTVAEEFLYRR